MRERENGVPLNSNYSRSQGSFMDRFTARSGAILHVVVPAILLVGMVMVVFFPLSSL